MFLHQLQSVNWFLVPHDVSLQFEKVLIEVANHFSLLTTNLEQQKLCFSPIFPKAFIVPLCHVFISKGK